MNSKEKFCKLLRLSALLPRADKDLQSKYNLTRQQIYLIYLVHNDDVMKPRKLKDYAQLLNISSSTLTRNVKKLETRKVLERMKWHDEKSYALRLLSLGKLYALEIEEYIDEYFRYVDIEGVWES